MIDNDYTYNTNTTTIPDNWTTTGDVVNKICPSCGRCDRCGRGPGDYPRYPYYPAYPWTYPYPGTVWISNIAC